MDKNEILTLSIILLVAAGAIGLMFYSDSFNSTGQAGLRKSMIQQPSLPVVPTPQAAPPSPTPVPQPRLTTEEIAQKPEKKEFPPEVSHYLQPGKLTTPGDALDALKQVKIQPIGPGPTKEGQTPFPPYVDNYEFNKVRGILNYVKNFDRYQSDPDCTNCWKRDVNDVFLNGISTGEPGKGTCSHYALLFITLARLYNIPARYTAVYYEDWASQQKTQGCWDGRTSGHTFAQVYINGTWYGVNPTGGTFVAMDERGNVFNGKSWAEGRDHADFMQFPERWCLEGYRYHAAIPGLLLCTNPKYTPTTKQWAMLLACSKPLQPFEFTAKGEK